MAKKPSVKPNTVSPWTLLNRWYQDGSSKSPIPPEVLQAKIVGGQTILYFFMNSEYSPFINKIFNNWDTFQLPQEDVLQFIKTSIQLSGYSDKFFKRFKEQRSQLHARLRQKYPLLKNDDLNLLCDIVDQRDDKDVIYETLGLKKPTKSKVSKSKKTTKKENALEGFDIN